MKKILATGLFGLVLSACFGIKEENYPELSPIAIEVVSDTINAQLGVPLHYEGIRISSDLPVTLEWAYGFPLKDTAPEQGKFESRTVLPATSVTIDHTFMDIGSFVLRLKADNGESIAYHYFRLNVNAGYDEGVTILDEDDSGKSALAFVKTLTAQEREEGKQELFYFDPVGGLHNGVSLFVTNANLSYGAGSQTAFVILTADENGSIYLLDAKTMELVQTSAMRPTFGTVPKEAGGEYARQNDMGLFFISEDGRAFRYDMLLGYITEINSPYTPVERVFAGLNRTVATGASDRYSFFLNQQTLFIRNSSSAGIHALNADEGYRIVNAAVARTRNAQQLYVLMQSKVDATIYRIRSAQKAFSASINNDSWGTFVNDFTADNLKMDSKSLMLGMKKSGDIYYSFDNAIYRWGLTTAPPTAPSIILPQGEMLMDIASNYMGGAASGIDGPDNGEDKLYVATYNPNRNGERKGSLYVYDITDNSLLASYEGICARPRKVIYKYRMN